MTQNEATRAGRIASFLAGHRRIVSEALQRLESDAGTIADAADLVIATLVGGGTIMLAGNGGSAAEAQHFAAELVGRFRRERPPYAALALTTDTSILTAIGNDYGFEDVFARQVLALGRPGDLLIAFSTSGESANLLKAAAACRENNVRVLAITGNRRSALGDAADINLVMPAPDTATIQELHTLVTHILCDHAEEAMAT